MLPLVMVRSTGMLSCTMRSISYTCNDVSTDVRDVTRGTAPTSENVLLPSI